MEEDRSRSGYKREIIETVNQIPAPFWINPNPTQPATQPTTQPATQQKVRSVIKKLKSLFVRLDVLVPFEMKNELNFVKAKTGISLGEMVRNALLDYLLKIRDKKDKGITWQ